MLTSTPQIIYKATIAETVTVTLTNATNFQIELDIYTTNESLSTNIGANAETVLDVALLIGDYIVGSSVTPVAYTITKLGVDITPAPLPNNELATLKTNAASAVGIVTSALTTAQVRALLCLALYKQGGIDEVTNKILPLDKWN